MVRYIVIKRHDKLWINAGYLSPRLLSTGCKQSLSPVSLVLIEGKTLNFMIK